MPRKPATFHGFVGDRPLVARLRRQVAGAKRRGECFPATGLFGPSGVGKTLLAEALAKEFGTTTHPAHGNDALADLVQTCGRAQFGDFIVIDEAHGLERKAQELAMFVIWCLTADGRAPAKWGRTIWMVEGTHQR